MSSDRQQILNTLIQRINAFSEGYRQNIAILGEPCIGKTSLISAALASDALKKDSIIYIYLDIKIEPFEFCARRFIKSAISQLITLDPIFTAQKEPVFLIQDLARIYPKIAHLCTRVLQDIEKGKFEEAFSFMMDIPFAISEETKKRCLVILDEFHNLDKFVLKNALGTLSKKIMIQKDTMYIILSSRSMVSQKLLNEKLSLLFGNFEKVHLSTFDVATSRSFLQENIKSARLPQSYLDFMASFTGNRPFYMRIICEEMDRAVYSGKIGPENYSDLVEHAMVETVFKKRSLINQHFSNFLFKLSEGRLLSKCISVLLVLSGENKKQRDIIKSSKLQQAEVSKILNMLIEMDIIVRNGAFYRFKDRLFRFWLQSVYLKRIDAFSIAEEIEESVFRKEVSRSLSEFMQEFEKDLSSRITELFKSFKNDIVQLNGKKHKFISFNAVQKNEHNDAQSTEIIASANMQKWLCKVKKDKITENDILDIIKDAKSQKKVDRITRNILIALGGIDENAYLMAKEAKFWTWDIDTLNVLMELYDKPHVITK